MIQFIALLVLTSCASSQHTVHYVRPDNSSSSSCPGQPCLTLDQYASQQAKYFTTGTTFLFLAGNHSINAPAILNSTFNITLKALDDNSDVTVVCKITLIAFIESVNLTIQGITFMLGTTDEEDFIAIFIIFKSSDISFINSTFSNLSAQVRAIYSYQSSVFVGRSKFEGSIGYSGGAIQIEKTNLSIEETTVQRNKEMDGGSELGGILILIGNAFEGKFGNFSGAIYAQETILIIEKTIFKRNKAMYGGAICAPRSNLVLIGNAFEGNFGKLGGAIDAVESNLTIERTIFERNEAMYGGAICSPGCNLTLIGNTFEENLGKFGGTINAKKTSITIEGTGFIGNTGEDGGTLAVVDSSLTITSSVFDSNTGGTLTILDSNLTVANSTFDSNTGIFGALSAVDSSLTITGSVFDNNTADPNGGAIAVEGSNLTITSTIFINNAGTFGGAIYALESNITLDGNFFNKNNAKETGGAILAGNQSYLLLNDNMGVTFAQNFAALYGGAVYCENSIFFIEGHSITNSTPGKVPNSLTKPVSGVILFVNNSVHWSNSSGGAVFIANATFTSNTKHLHFTENAAFGGGGILCAHAKSNISVLSANFTNNEETAILIHVSNASFHNFFATANKNVLTAELFSTVSFSGDVNISRNYGLSIYSSIFTQFSSTISFTGYTVFEKNRSKFGGAIGAYTQSTLSFRGTVLFKENYGDLDGGAVRAYATTTIIMGGNVSFIANRAGRNGGAVIFDIDAVLFLKQHLSLTFSNNHASEYGGALFHSDAPRPNQCKNTLVRSLCFIKFFRETSHYFPAKISARNNSADKDGSFLFGGLLDKCRVITTSVASFEQDIFYPVFLNMTDLQSGTAVTPAISSEAYQLCFCESTEIFDCKVVRTYRGGKFTVPLLALAQGDTVTSSPVRAIQSSTARLLPDQRSQYLPRNCTSLTFNMYSSREQEQLVLYLDDSPCLDTGLSRAVINVTFLPCPDAFTLSGDQCVCEERLQKYNANCTIFDDNAYIIRNTGSKFWLSPLKLSDGTYRGLVLYRMCPTRYCKSDSVNITLLDPNIQCAHNRSGVLCGACAANYSLTFGSSTCETCSNTHLALLLVFAAAGIVLVVFLTLLRLTVATGMINSVILYANMLQCNQDTLFSNSSNFLQVFIAWMNLGLGFQVCFYDGMDAYVQTWLQLAFPIYVWILISLVILASRYSTSVTKLIGSNPIAVLATLLLMSYTKLLKIIIEVYSSVDLEYPGNKTVTVWLKDANEPYLKSRHLALTVVTTLLLVFLFLPYTLLLLLGYKLYRFTGRRHTRWLMRIKPLLDAYYAPYKMHTRYWTGFLLLVRCALYIVFSYNSLGHNTLSLVAINITFAGIVVWLTLKLYSKLLVNSLEALVLSNLIVLSTAALAGVDSPTLVDSLVGMVFVIMMGIIIYHFHIFYIAKSALWLKLRAKMTALRAKPTETTPLLAPVAPQRVPAVSATPPQREPTRSVVFISK